MQGVSIKLRGAPTGFQNQAKGQRAAAWTNSNAEAEQCIVSPSPNTNSTTQSQCMCKIAGSTPSGQQGSRQIPSRPCTK
eukprot:1149897-Pelagomonas_calceolata.AAC.5